jgi:hypothetical protein
MAGTVMPGKQWPWSSLQYDYWRDAWQQKWLTQRHKGRKVDMPSAIPMAVASRTHRHPKVDVCATQPALQSPRTPNPEPRIPNPCPHGSSVSNRSLYSISSGLPGAATCN